MARLWLPGATRMYAQIDGGSMIGGAPRVGWHTVEAGYNAWSAYDAARYLVTHRNQPQIIFHPISGDVYQTAPANRAGRSFANPGGYPQTNRKGDFCIQIEVVGQAAHPWTDDITEAGIKTLRAMLAWFDELGVPRALPNGLPTATYAEANAPGHRSVANWEQGGHFQHSDVPQNGHWDSGAIDMKWILSLDHKGKIHVGGSGGSGGKAPAPGRSWNMPDITTDVLKALQKKVGVTADGVEGPKTAKAVQEWLGVAVDGYWGVNTITALQKKIGSSADGVWGPNTAAALSDYLLGKDDEGGYYNPSGTYSVRKIQRIVGVPADGLYGPATKKAVKALQRDLGVAVDGLWGPATERAYEASKGGPDLVVDGILGKNTIRALQDWVGVTQDGIMGNGTERALQRKLGVTVDGIVGPSTIRALQREVGAPVDGIWGNGTTRHLQRYLNRVL